MAYSDYGAFVHKDGVRRTDREDVAVFNDDEKVYNAAYRIFANIQRNREKCPDGNTPWHARSHHAVLGDGPIRLCGYKTSAELWDATGDEVTRVDLDRFLINADGDDEHAGEWNGVTFTTRQAEGDCGQVVTLTLVEADGAKWEATCGYLYGAGHMDEEMS